MQRMQRMHTHKQHIHTRRTARGATAIEFALLFPLFFLIFYAIVTYSLIFVAQQSLTLAAEEGARAALNFQKADSVSAALTLRAGAACSTANNLTNWLADSAKCVATPNPCTFNTAMECVTVTLSYDYAARPLVPSLPGLGIALPAQLTSTAMVQLNPGFVL
ncbi:MAG TPA: TadE/TadG family type IV pilus assembly protein [Paraburkholderia sp.]|jgi:Flp pilus assembly protein TadG